MSDIHFAWGGCGNLINNCLQSTEHFDLIKNYYESIDLNSLWVEQEWALRSKIGEHLVHNYNGDINLAWSNSLDCCFHYLIKNIQLNHLAGPMIDRVQGVIRMVTREETAIRAGQHWVVDHLLLDFDQLYNHCYRIQPVDKDNMKIIFKLWLEKSRLFYQANEQTALEYFAKIGIDYQPTTLYNILYENTNP